MYLVMSQRRAGRIPAPRQPVPPSVPGRAIPHLRDTRRPAAAGTGSRVLTTVHFRMCRTLTGARLHAAGQWLTGARGIEIVPQRST